MPTARGRKLLALDRPFPIAIERLEGPVMAAILTLRGGRRYPLPARPDPLREDAS
jgi:hypothetical protein